MLALALAIACVIGVTASAGAQTSVQRGRYLVETIGACANCHTPKGPEGDIADKHLAGGFGSEESFGTWVAPNITPDRQTGIGAWTDVELVRAIREGKHRSGRTLGPPMPFAEYRKLSDRDVKAMVAYLRTVKPVRNQAPRSLYTVPLPASYGPPVVSVPDTSQRDPLAYGAYLAGPVAHCVECHTPLTADGQPDPARVFAGGMPFKGPWGTSYAANITPDAETGIGRWTDEEITRAFVNGIRPGGRVLLPPMPWPYYAVRVAASDARAIVAYLRSLPPIPHKVPPPEPPKP